MLDDGKIPFEQLNVHRTVSLADVLAFKERRHPGPRHHHRLGPVRTVIALSTEIRVRGLRTKLSNNLLACHQTTVSLD